MRPWPRPSLAGRVVLTLLMAFLLVWAALLVHEYLDFKDDARHLKTLTQAAKSLAAALDFDDAARARIVLEATERLVNASRRSGPVPEASDMLWLLERAGGAPVYASRPLLERRIPRGGEGRERVRVDGRDYWSVVYTTRDWRMQLLEPVIGDRDALAILGSDLLPYLVIAFPLVLVPMWLAVQRGLAPLRRFVARVEARPAGDFLPFEEDLKYAELLPLGRAFDALLARTRQGIARERAFVQDAAHELRTPLAVISAQGHVLLRATDDAQRHQAEAALEQAVARASRLVGQLLTLASLEGGGGTPPRSVDLVALSRDLLIAVAPLTAAKRIEIALDSPDRIDTCLDAAAFHSILENLLANAAAYCQEGAQVWVKLSKEGGFIRLRVADNGPGIAPEERSKLFERFHRGRGATTRGSGLGLAIVRQAVGNLGGTVRVDAGADDHGTAFDVSWPHRETHHPPVNRPNGSC
ncbi:sensor histidine kinase [Endothiovibrio diazotrophicus]